jgi:hypothetical protein
MSRSITQRIVTLGLAAVAVTAISGTVSGASDEATTCRTWHPDTIVEGQYQHTWNPDDAIDGQYQHTWNPDDATDGGYQHTWNPDDATGGQYQHTWNPDDATDGQYQHTLNPAGDRSDACPSPSGSTP